MRTFEQFFKQFGLTEYPFATFSAEVERKRLEQLFVRPAVYSPLVGTFGDRSSVIISGERGTGKTALVYELMRNIDSKRLCVYVDDFSGLDINHDSAALYKFLVDSVAEELFKSLVGRGWRIWSLSKDERILLSYLLKYHVASPSIARIEEKIRKIQVPFPKRFAFWIYNRARGVFNYGASAALNVTSDLVARHFPGLPPVELGDHRDYFPALRSDAPASVELAAANYSLLVRITQLCMSLGMSGVTFVLDKIDEEPRLENDAADIAEFLRVFLTDNKLLLSSGVQFVISCWAIPLEQLKSKVRFQKLSVQKVSWKNDELLDVLNQRLRIFSQKKLESYAQLFSEDAAKVFDEIIDLANGNPRDLWHLMGAIFKKQYEMDADSSKIDVAACHAGARKFVEEFNFYEYYPRSSGARSNSMDVYSYIAHLLKLSSFTFTKNQLNEQAQTGSSTSNYVVAMENMGLIGKSDEKADGGAVVYLVRDPKVKFAREHAIAIQRIS